MIGLISNTFLQCALWTISKKLKLTNSKIDINEESPKFATKAALQMQGKNIHT
jgi:hypothetical protein